MNPPIFRLDDIARDVVHYAPDVLFELFDPVESPYPVTWERWTPDMDKRRRRMSVRTEIRRLDTQLSPQRWLPDAAYTCLARNVRELWAPELQSAARRSPPARASTCLMNLWRQAFPGLAYDDVTCRMLEVRTRQAPRKSTTFPQPKVTVRRPRAGLLSEPRAASRADEGLLRFEPTDALCTMDPWDRRFSHPRAWPLASLSQRVTADHIALRLARLVELERTYAYPLLEVHLLLGRVGRVRFPKDARFELAVEYPMNNLAVENALDFGHLTEEERRRILLDAKEQHLRIQAERLREAELRGLVEGERRGLVDAARMTLTLSLPADEVNSALTSLEHLNSIEQIRAALAELVNGARRR